LNALKRIILTETEYNLLVWVLYHDTIEYSSEAQKLAYRIEQHSETDKEEQTDEE
jgi:hypothetical protein